MNSQLIKRIKSFVWRFLVVAVVAGLEYLAENISLFSLPQEVVVIIGLVVGEITKWLNNKFRLKRNTKSKAKKSNA